MSKFAQGRGVDPTPPETITINTSFLPPYATNALEWWEIVDTIWPAIVVVAKRVGESDDTIQFADRYRAKRDKMLAGFLDSIWSAAPDEHFIHSWPCWQHICDLCSEHYVLDEE